VNIKKNKKLLNFIVASLREALPVLNTRPAKSLLKESPFIYRGYNSPPNTRLGKSISHPCASDPAKAGRVLLRPKGGKGRGCNCYPGESSNNKDINNNSFLLLIHKLFKKIKIPLYLRIVFIFFILNIVVLKLLGYNIFSLITDKSLLRNLIFVYFFLVTSYQLLNLYLAHIFANKKIKIPEILPDFLINWLKEFEIITLTEESIKGFKKTCYIELLVYFAMMVFFILILL
jgi:hypothetical protein